MNKEKQFDLFDINRGIELRDIGMQIAADNKKHALEFARNEAIKIALQSFDRTCCIDEVQAVLIPLGIKLGQAAGSVFKKDQWEFVGTKKTKRTSSHARPISVWRLK